MRRLIAWLLEHFTDFRVVAWSRGKIMGIGTPNNTRFQMRQWDGEASQYESLAEGLHQTPEERLQYFADRQACWNKELT